MINLSDDINVLLGIVNNGYDKNHLILNVDKFSSVIKTSGNELNDITSRLQSKRDIFNLSYDDRDLVVNFRDLYSYGLKSIISRRNNSITFTFSSKFIREYGENHYIRIVSRFFNELEFEIDEYELHQRLEVGYIEIALDFFGISTRDKIKDIRGKIIANYFKTRKIEKRTIIINRKYDTGYNYIEVNENDKDTFLKAYFDSHKDSHIKIYDKLTNAFSERINENNHWISYFVQVLYGLDSTCSTKFMEIYTNLPSNEKTIVFNEMFKSQSITRLEYSINNRTIDKFISYEDNPLNPDYILIANALNNKHLLLKYLIYNIWNITYKDRNKFKILPLFKSALDFIDNYEPEENNEIHTDKGIELMNNILKSIDYAARIRGGIKSIIESAKYYASQGGDVDELISIISQTSEMIISGLDEIYAMKSNESSHMIEMN